MRMVCVCKEEGKSILLQEIKQQRTLLTVTINACSRHIKSTGKNANLQYKHSDKEKTEDSKAMKNEIGGHLSGHHHNNTLAYNTPFSMRITSKTGCATGLMSLVSDLNHE